MTTAETMKDMRVALLGGGGFIGTNLALALAGKVAELRGFGRRRVFPAAWQGLAWTDGEIGGADVRQVIYGCDTVIHLAGTSTPGTADRKIADDADVNVIDTLKLLDQCAELGVRRVIFISSGGTVYGIPREIPTPEQAATDPITAYGVAKLAIEKYLMVYRRQRGVNYRILRVANPFGPYQTTRKAQGVVAAVIASALHDTPLQIWGDGRVVRDYVFVNDVVSAVEKVLDHQGDSRVFNIGSGKGHDLMDVVGAVESLTARKLRLEFLPARPVDVPVSVLDSALATRELGWHCATCFESGLAKTLQWARNFESGTASHL